LNGFIEYNKRELFLLIEMVFMEKLITTLFEHSPEAIFIMHDKHFVDCNIAAVKLFDYDNKSLLRHKTPSALSPVFQPDGQLSCVKEEQIVKSVLNGETQRFEWTFLHPNGNEFLVEVALSQTLLDGKVFLPLVQR